MEVIKHQGGRRCAEAVELAENGFKDGALSNRFQRRLRQKCRRSPQEAGIDRLTGGDQVAKEDEAVGVVFVQAVPEGSELRPTQIVGHESRLAEAGLGDEVDHPSVSAGFEPIE